MKLPEILRNYNLYHLLGVQTFADVREIKRGYRNFALKHHPDRLEGDARSSSRVFDLGTQAYKLLINEETRNRYNQTLRNKLRRILNLRNKEFVVQRKKTHKRFYVRRSMWDPDYTRFIDECRANFQEYLKNLHTVKARPKVFSEKTMDTEEYREFVEDGRASFSDFLDSLPRVRRTRLR